MDPGCVRILEEVRKCNARGQEVCQSDIFALNLAAPPTIQKRITEMLTDGDLKGLYVQTPHGTKRLLFVPEYYSSAETTVLHNLLGMTNFQLRRCADALEAIAKSQGAPSTGGKAPSDSHVQVRLWSED